MLNDTEFLHIVDATPLVSIDLVVRNEHGEVLLGQRVNGPRRVYGSCRRTHSQKRARGGSARENFAARTRRDDRRGEIARRVRSHLPGQLSRAPGVNTHYVVLGMAAELAGDVRFTADEQHDELKWWSVAEILASDLVHENTKAYFRN